MPENEIDTANRLGVGMQGDAIVILIPATRLTKAETLAHAAWLVALADDEDQFGAYLEAVQNT